jgi:lipid II:glycine glycyltransferase (peptidoglycan interpeptide bridge formation enzyme)
MLLRKVPKVERYLSYLPEGPDLDWANKDLVESSLEALTSYAKSIGVFQIKMGPHVWTKRWDAEDLKNAIAQEMATKISQVPASQTNEAGNELIKQLRECGWQQPDAVDAGFGDYQPRYVFQIALEGKSEENLFEGFNQLWRRNIRKADKQGVTVRQGTRSDLPAFHACYVETAIRDQFTPRPLSYFEHMWDAMSAEDSERIAVYLAEHEEHEGAIAATTMTRVGQHAWYSYGASTTAARDLRPSNAIQWAMIRDALNVGACVYDMRGISDTLDSQNHLFGLIQFKLGTGGYAQEYVGEWDYVISPFWAKAFNFYMARR